VLVLTRRSGQRLMIGDDITVTVLGIRGDIVRLGIEAPADVRVHREENYRVSAETDLPVGAQPEILDASPSPIGLSRVEDDHRPEDPRP
jgi:carbon storage regulator